MKRCLTHGVIPTSYPSLHFMVDLIWLRETSSTRYSNYDKQSLTECYGSMRFVLIRQIYSKETSKYDT